MFRFTALAFEYWTRHAEGVSKPAAPGIRARVRAELTEAIKTTARTHLASEGAPSLSLRAVARELEMASSAIYRYFPSREALLTALIIDAYNTVGACVEEADAGRERDDLEGRWIAIGSAVREWARANPHEYALIYGSPVPGYAAPDDTIVPATRATLVMLQLLADAIAINGAPDDTTEIPEPLRSELAAVESFADGSVPPAVAAIGLAAWAEMLGMISLELFGHLENVVYDRDAFYNHTMRATGARLLR